jgi:hypothetical protein
VAEVVAAELPPPPCAAPLVPWPLVPGGTPVFPVPLSGATVVVVGGAATASVGGGAEGVTAGVGAEMAAPPGWIDDAAIVQSALAFPAILSSTGLAAAVTWKISHPVWD